MADDAHLTDRHQATDGETRFSDMAREELSVTARAFFAPVVGAVHVVRALLSERHGDEPHRERDAA